MYLKADQPFTIFAKKLILDVWQDSEYVFVSYRSLGHPRFSFFKTLQNTHTLHYKN